MKGTVTATGARRRGSPLFGEMNVLSESGAVLGTGSVLIEKSLPILTRRADVPARCTLAGSARTREATDYRSSNGGRPRDLCYRRTPGCALGLPV